MAAQGNSPELPVLEKERYTSPDHSCPSTAMAGYSLLSSYSSPPQEVSLAEHELINSGLLGQPCLHVSVERSKKWTLCANAHFLIWKERSSPCGPCFPGNVPTSGRCVPRVHARPDACSKRPFPHLLKNLGVHTTASHRNSRDFDETLRAKSQP